MKYVTLTVVIFKWYGFIYLLLMILLFQFYGFSLVNTIGTEPSACEFSHINSTNNTAITFLRISILSNTQFANKKNTGRELSFKDEITSDSIIFCAFFYFIVDVRHSIYLSSRSVCFCRLQTQRGSWPPRTRKPYYMALVLH